MYAALSVSRVGDRRRVLHWLCHGVKLVRLHSLFEERSIEVGVATNIALLNKAAAFKASDLDGGSLRLFQNNFTPDRNSVDADFDVADFGGYANITIATFNDPFMDILGRAITLAPTQVFAASGVAPSNLIYGWYFRNVAGDVILAERFASPISMAAITDALPLAIQSIEAQPSP